MKNMGGGSKKKLTQKILLVDLILDLVREDQEDQEDLVEIQKVSKISGKKYKISFLKEMAEKEDHHKLIKE